MPPPTPDNPVRTDREARAVALLAHLAAPDPPRDLRARVLTAVTTPRRGYRHLWPLAAGLAAALALTIFQPVGNRVVQVGPGDLSVAPYARAHLASLGLPAEASPATDLTPVAGFRANAPASIASGWKLVTTRQGDCPCSCGGLETHLVYARGGEQVSVFVCSVTCQSCVATARLRAQNPGTVASTVDGLGVVARLDRAPVVLAVGSAPQAELVSLAEAVP